MQATFSFTKKIGRDTSRSYYTRILARPIYRMTFASDGETNKVISNQPSQIKVESFLETGTFATAGHLSLTDLVNSSQLIFK